MIPEFGHYALILALCIAIIQGMLPLVGAHQPRVFPGHAAGTSRLLLRLWKGRYRDRAKLSQPRRSACDGLRQRDGFRLRRRTSHRRARAAHVQGDLRIPLRQAPPGLRDEREQRAEGPRGSRRARR